MCGIEKSGPNTRKYFQAVKQLGSASANTNAWSLLDLFPGATDKAAGEEAARYFTRITGTFEPLRDDERHDAPLRLPQTVDKVAKRLKTAKKPGSQVRGDLLP